MIKLCERIEEINKVTSPMIDLESGGMPPVTSSAANTEKQPATTTVTPGHILTLDAIVLDSQEGNRVPLASLDCMEEFTVANDGTPIHSHLDPSRSPYHVGIKYRNLGKSGLRVSNVSLGTWVTFGSDISDEVAEDIMSVAYESGVNVFDTTDVSDIVVGKILKNKGWRRSSYVITTKVGQNGKSEWEKGISRKRIIESLVASLGRLDLPYVDVVFVCRTDPLCPMEEIVRAMTYCINQGYTMYWGTYGWSGMEIMEAFSVARQCHLIPPTVEQTEYHIFRRDKVETYLPELYHKIGVGLMTWSPFTCGLSPVKPEDCLSITSHSSSKTGAVGSSPKRSYNWLKDRINTSESRKMKLREVGLIADKLQCSLTQLILAWSLKNDNITSVFLGASSVDQLVDHIRALQIVPKLTSSLLAEIEKILENKPIRQALQR